MLIHVLIDLTLLLSSLNTVLDEKITKVTALDLGNVYRVETLREPDLLYYRALDHLIVKHSQKLSQAEADDYCTDLRLWTFEVQESMDLDDIFQTLNINSLWTGIKSPSPKGTFSFLVDHDGLIIPDTFSSPPKSLIPPPTTPRITPNSTFILESKNDAYHLLVKNKEELHDVVCYQKLKFPFSGRNLNDLIELKTEALTLFIQMKETTETFEKQVIILKNRVPITDLSSTENPEEVNDLTAKIQSTIEVFSTSLENLINKLERIDTPLDAQVFAVGIQTQTQALKSIFDEIVSPFMFPEMFLGPLLAPSQAVSSFFNPSTNTVTLRFTEALEEDPSENNSTAPWLNMIFEKLREKIKTVGVEPPNAFLKFDIYDIIFGFMSTSMVLLEVYRKTRGYLTKKKGLGSYKNSKNRKNNLSRTHRVHYKPARSRSLEKLESHISTASCEGCKDRKKATFPTTLRTVGQNTCTRHSRNTASTRTKTVNSTPPTPLWRTESLLSIE